MESPVYWQNLNILEILYYQDILNPTDHLIPGGEGFTTELTAVRPGVSMDPLMFPQQISPLEVLRTVGALEGSLVCVNTTNVEQELSFPGVTGTTDITDIRLLT